MSPKVGCFCIRAGRRRNYTWELILIVIATGLVIVSIAGPRSVYTAFTTARGSLASLLGYDSADLTFLACTTTGDAGPNYWDRTTDGEQCKGTVTFPLKAMSHHD